MRTVLAVHICHFFKKKIKLLTWVVNLGVGSSQMLNHRLMSRQRKLQILHVLLLWYIIKVHKNLTNHETILVLYIYIYSANMRVTLLYYYKTYFSSSLILHSSMNVSHKCSYNHFISPTCAVKQNMTEHMNIEHTKMDKKWRKKLVIFLWTGIHGVLQVFLLHFPIIHKQSWQASLLLCVSINI